MDFFYPGSIGRGCHIRFRLVAISVALVSNPQYTVLYRTDGWVLAEVIAGNLPDIMYDWSPASTVEARQESGELVVAVWTDPDTGSQHWISHPEMPDVFLTAPKAQWDEVVSGRRGQTIH